MREKSTHWVHSFCAILATKTDENLKRICTYMYIYVHTFTTALLIGFGLVQLTTVGQENRVPAHSGPYVDLVVWLSGTDFAWWPIFTHSLCPSHLPPVSHAAPPFAVLLCSMYGPGWVWVAPGSTQPPGRHRCLIRPGNKRYGELMSPNGSLEEGSTHALASHPQVTQQDAHQASMYCGGNASGKTPQSSFIFYTFSFLPKIFPG